ncbi:TRAP transporter large permease [Arenibacter sp. ARW7G5Y1]|uniref:TRAP transporter large permease n=1 Tax=Arenibacter sp. ARW7G5Y1 TaxID=2135619 RepID=UPI000D753BA9|nr:TRAP transporter large permease [Arenibacter sp. ARW7G5Y1]PXX21657.1 C4-dicarboxylate transporter DctM subunit [Arenibacter sp. ARW7G5Y1]
MIVLILSMIILLVLGVRVAYSIGISTLIYIVFFTNISPLVIVQQITAGADSLVLLAIPFFLLAGEVMNASGITHRLVRLSLAILGNARGGLSYVVILVNIMMAMVSGAAIASAAAVGSTMIPEMEKKGYPKGYAAAVNAAAATIGPVIPPSIGFIIYASLSGASVGRLFVAGMLPGLLIGLIIMTICFFVARKKDLPLGEDRDWGELKSSFNNAIWSLLMPVIILGGILTGIVTPTEAGVLAVVYALIVGLFIHKDLLIKDLVPILVRAGRQTAIIMIIIACSSAFGFLIVREIPQEAFLESFVMFKGNSVLLLFTLTALILVLGMVMEGGSIMIILTPLLLPILNQYNIDLVHFGVVFQLAIMIGLLTPPVGILLFVVSSAGNVDVKEIMGNIWPFYIGLFIVLVLAVVFPEISLFLVEFFEGNLSS